MKIRDFTPNYFSKILWGNRAKWGKTINYSDVDWVAWGKTYINFYTSNQRAGVGKLVNEMGYKVMSHANLENLTVLEIGAGDVQHLRYVEGRPSEYIVADVSAEMLETARRKLNSASLNSREILLKRGEKLPVSDNSIDIVISFYALEHIHPLQPYLQEIYRVLKPGGMLIGAIPAEGGLAWGLGRAITTRRWFKRNTNIDPDKIICWEHPNFADEIIRELNRHFRFSRIQYWPLWFLKNIDFNLVIKFRCIKSKV